ncbi:MAG TPA: PhzF family phenazine biosynthesis isomerase, partial [Ktedonobacterales bacterium]
MRRYRFVQLDVFTDRAFGGNQLAVFLEAAGLSDTEMRAITREMNYSETTFVLPPSDPKALRRVRIFTPTAELPLAGHPTVGTTFALAYEGAIHAYDEQPIYLELGVGTLPIDLLFEEDHLSFVWMHQP